MKRKVLCSILAILIILASVPMTAFAADGGKIITDISLTATRDLIQYYDGWYNHEEGTPYFYYKVFDGARPDMFVTYSDGSSENVSYDNFHEHFWSTNVVTLQSVATEFGLGTNTAEIEIFYGDEGEKSIKTSIDFTIIENPVESFSVIANKPLIENVSGSYQDKYDEYGNFSEQYFCYCYEFADIEITVNYKNGESKIYTYTGNSETNISDITGYELCFDGDQANNPFVLGENVVDVSYMGIKSTITFNVIVNPVEKITVVPNKKIQYEVDGSWTECYESDGEYFNHDISLTEPQIIVEYNDGTPTKTCAWDECYEVFGEEPSFECDQEKTPFSIGENSVTVKFLGKESTYTFEILPNPIKSVSLDVRYKLEENKSGDMVDVYDDEDNYIGQYFYYDLDLEKTFLTVEYNDETKESLTFCLNDLGEYFEDGIDIDLGQSYENPLEPGKHTGKATFMGVSCEFEFEILENPIKSVSAKATRDLKENVGGFLNGEDYGEPYYYYYISETMPEITVSYKDGTVKTYTYSELSSSEKDFNLYAEQSAEKPLKPGTNTAILEFEGLKCEFTFNIIEDPVKSIVITPTKDLVEYTDGYVVENNDEEYFYYYLENLMPNVTINYKDGTKKVYDYITLSRYTDIDINFAFYQEANPFKLGENTATATYGSKEIEYKFNIVKQNSSQKVKSLEVIPEQKMIENYGGWFNEEYIGDSYEEVIEYYFYDSELMTYTVVVTFEDGNTKTYKNVKSFDEIEGSDFDVCYEQSFDNHLKVGKNKVIAKYRNAECEFDVEVVENNYTAVNISGDNELVLTFTKTDGTKESYKAISFDARAGGGNISRGYLYTESGQIFEVEISHNITEDGSSFEDIQLAIFEDDDKLESNVLKSNEWFDMITFVSNINSCAAIYADGFSKHFYNRDFTGLNGTFTGTNVDDILTMCTYSTAYENYKDTGIDEKGNYAILSLEEAETLASRYFDISKIDFTSSPMYNSGPKEIKVYFIRWREGNIKNEVLKYSGGKFIYSSDYTSTYTDASFPVTIVLDANGLVESIAFTKGVCGAIKTINASNTKDGVKITYSASENATEYEIYRSLNGGKYEKIGTTTELSYLDTSAVSGKTYTYKVRGVNDTNVGNFSGAKTVSYLAMPKTTATLGKSGYTVKWTKVTGAATYRIYRAEYANGKWSNWNKLSDQKASVTSYADKNVKAGGVYKYTVRAMASGGVASAYEGTPVLVYLTTPTVKIANAKGGVKGSWNAVAGAEGYIIYRSEYNSSTKKWSSWTNLGTTKATAKSFTDKTAVSGKTYRYTVRAVNGDNKSLYTASNTLLYLAEPTVTIANAKTGIAVKWTKSGGAKGYTVYRSEYNASTKKWSSWKSIATTGSSSTSLTDKTAKSGGTYRYTVRAVNEKVMSTFTASATLVRLAQPTVTIANAKTGVTVKWSKVTGVTGYKIYRQEFVDGKWSNWSSTATAKANKTSWTDTKAVSGKTYRYAVRAMNGKSLSSYTATTSLMFLGEPTVKIANASKGIKVSWELIDGATSYTIYRSEYNTKTKKWSSWSNRGTAKAGKSSWTDKKVTSGVQYKYTVRAINGNFKSTYTSSGKLVYLAQPTVTAAKTTNGTVVKWTKSAGSTSYIVYRQEMTESGWSKWKSIATIKSTNSYSDKTVESGKEYRYTVRAVSGNYKSSYSASNSVKR